MRHNAVGCVAPLVAAAVFLAFAAPAEGQIPPYVDTHVNDNGTGNTGSGSSYSNGTYTVNGSGADIWTIDDGAGNPLPQDEFQFVHQQTSGDFQLVARVVSLSGSTNPWAKAGVMVRQNAITNPVDNNERGAVYAYVCVTPSNGLNLQWRQTAGGWCGNTQGVVTTAPVWVKLIRRGNTFFGYYSGNGTIWTFLGAVNVTMTDPVEVGIAVTAHDDAQLATATVTDLSFGTIQSPPNPVTQTPVPPGLGSGLVGDYYDIDPPAAQPTFPASPTATRTDSSINFNWGNGNIGPLTGGTPTDGVLVRWSGSIEPRYTGYYTFYTRTDDGVRLWIDDPAQAYPPLIDQWRDMGPTWYGGMVYLQAGYQYSIIMEYYENAGGAVAELYWESSDGQSFETVPGTQLYTTSSPRGGQPGPHITPPPPPPGGEDGREHPNGNDGINDACWGGSSVSASPGTAGLLPALLGIAFFLPRRRR